jgi:hypothetical protein
MLAKKHPETNDTKQRLIIGIGQLKQKKKNGNSKKLIFTSILKLASCLFFENKALIAVYKKNANRAQKLMFLIPLINSDLLIFTNENKLQATTMADKTNDPKGKQKHSKTGKK